MLGYFLYHTVEGERGWVAQMNMQQRVIQAQDHYDRIHKEREALEHRVKLMRPDSLDPDLLEEEARKNLNYSKPNEIVILVPAEKKTDILDK